MRRKRLKQSEQTNEGGATKKKGAPPSDSFVLPTGKLTNTILDEKLIRDFCKLTLEGLPADSACDYLGIMPSTYWAWMAKGQLYLNGDEEPKEFRMYGVFVFAYRRAKATYLKGRVDSLHAKDNGSWFRDMEILSRRDRRTWSRDEPAGGTEEQFSPDDKFL